MSRAARRSSIVSSATLVPISSIGAVFVCAFFIAGLAKDVADTQRRVEELKHSRTSVEAEIIQQMASQAATMAEIQAQAAATDAKVSIILDMAKTDVRSRLNQRY